MAVKVTISGLNEWNGWVELTPKEIEKRAVKELKRSGTSVQGNAKGLAPVDTGKLRASIETEFDSSGTLREIAIFSMLSYSAYQEYGTVKNRPQPYLIPSFNREINVFERNIRLALLRGLD